MFSNPYLSFFNCFSFDKLSRIRRISKRTNKKSTIANKNIRAYYNKSDKPLHPTSLSPSSSQMHFDRTYNNFFSKKMLLNYCSESLMNKYPGSKSKGKHFKLNKLNKSCGTTFTHASQTKSEIECANNKQLISNIHRYYNNIGVNKKNAIVNKLIEGTFYKNNTRNLNSNEGGDCLFKYGFNKRNNISDNKSSFFVNEVHNGSWSGIKRKNLNNNHSLMLPKNKVHVREIVFNGEDKDTMIVKKRMCVILKKRSLKEQENKNS